MKYTKAAAVVAGSAAVLGAASPAFADGIGDKGSLAESRTVSHNTVENPLEDVDATINGAVNTATQAGAGALGPAKGAPVAGPMIGGLPAGPIG